MPPDHIFRALARHGMVLDNMAFFRAGSRLLTAVPLLADTTAVDGASEGASMHLVNVYKFGDEVAGHKVGPVWVWTGGRFAPLLLAHFPSTLRFPKAQPIGRFMHAQCWPLCCTVAGSGAWRTSCCSHGRDVRVGQA